MTNSNNTAHHHEEGYLLGDWHVFPKSGVVAKGSYHTHAEPKVMQVLECLIMEQGKMVSREALIERVWPRVVVNEEVLTRAISELRTLLGDVSRERRYIITVPKRGYKLIMPALPLPDSSQAQSGSGETRQSAKTAESEGRYGLILTAVAAIRRVLERPLTVYLCLSMLGVWSWINSTGMNNNTHVRTLQSNTEYSTPSTVYPSTHPTTFLSSTRPASLQTELQHLQIPGITDESNGRIQSAGRQSVLLMPLTVITDNERTRAFAAGLAEDLQHVLFRQTTMRVVQHSESHVSNPDLILSGSVRIYDDLARINLQLVDAHSASLLWSSSFECIVDTPLSLQAQIARYTGEQLQQSLAAYI